MLGNQNILTHSLKPNKEQKQLIYHKGSPSNKRIETMFIHPLSFQLICYAQTGTDEEYAPSVIINKKRFVFDKIAGYSNEKTLDYCEINPFYFSFKNRDFLLFRAFKCMSSNYCDFLMVLFDVTQKDKPKIILCEEDAEASPDCFGDFNNDGYLDFAHRSNSKKRLECYSLYDDKFKKLENVYLILNGDEHNLQVNTSQSKWFFDLNK
jgi:hypothetical protein